MGKGGNLEGEVVILELGIVGLALMARAGSAITGMVDGTLPDRAEACAK